MDLSIVDIAPVRKGHTATDTFEDSVRLAQAADTAGYRRYWVAEHHGMGQSVASTTPEVLIAHLATRTEDIRLGSGTVLLNHYSAFKVAETFCVLDALTPGRIDLGLGRAVGMPAADRALQSGVSPQVIETDHQDKIEEVARHLDGAFPEDHPYNDIVLPRSADSVPVVWVLGSSPSSAKIAGSLGLRYAFAAFIRPEFAKTALETYQETFQASAFDLGIDEPHTALAINCAVAETDEAAARLRASSEAAYRRMAQGRIGPPLSVDEAIDLLGSVPEPTPVSVVDDDWPRVVSGSPETIETILSGMASRVNVDELIIQNLIEDPEDRITSHRLLAEQVG